jgi:phage gpG-like protein
VISVAVRLTHNRLDRLSAAMVAAAARERLATALEIEADWKGDVRVDTGNYRRSIHTDDGERQSVVSSNVDYALYNEYGTSRGMPARPSATKAGEARRHAYPARVAAALRRAG